MRFKILRKAAIFLMSQRPQEKTVVQSPLMALHDSLPGLIVLDMSYTYKMFNDLKIKEALFSRELNGFFGHVISVHPLSGLFEVGDAQFGHPTEHFVNERHIFIEGKIGRRQYKGVLKFIAIFSFFIAQIDVIKKIIYRSSTRNISVIRVGDPYYLGLLGLFLSWYFSAPLAIRVPFRYDEIRRRTGRAVMPRMFFFPWVEKLIERIVFPRCDLIAGANDDNMRYALENGGRHEVATVFRYGNLIHPSHWIIPQERETPYDFLHKFGLSGKKFIITISRLEPVKQPEDVILVMSLLVKNFDIYAVIIGDGSLLPSLKDLAKQLGIQDRILFTGNQCQDTIARVLPLASAVVSPHMGRALVESALAGKAIVAYDYDWQRELVIDGDTGYRVPNGDWRSMGAALARILSDDQTCKRLGDRARAHTLKMMHPQELIKHEIEWFKKIIKSSRSN